MTFKELKPALFLAVSVLFATVVFSYKAGEKSALHPEPTATKTEIQASSEEIVENEPSEEKSQETVVAENFFALLVGVGDYLHSCEYLPDLVYTCSDVLKVKRALTEKIGVPEENIRTLTTLEDDPAKRPTRENIENGLGWLEDKSRSGSAALAMFAGHGFETKNGEAAFAPEDVELYANGVLKAETATSATALAKRLQGVDAEFKILIVDACRTPAGVDGKLGTFVAPPSFARLNKAGLAFAQSCNVGESSYETSELDGGVFTHFLVEGLNGRAREEDGRVTFWGVAGYAAKKTSEYVKKRAEAEKNKEEKEKVFKTLQTPTYTAIGYQDFNLRESKAELLYREGRALAFGLDGTVVDGVRGFQLLTEATEEGSLEAQAELAWLYLNGCAATRQDVKKAIELAYEPARRGNPFAQTVLANLYGGGQVLFEDTDEVRKYLAESIIGIERYAENGDVRAMTIRGVTCESKLFDNNYTEAVKWYRKASERKCAKATAQLARCYKYGLGVEKDEKEAERLLQESADQNHVLGITGLAIWREENGDFKASEALYRRAAEQNDVEAILLLASRHFVGRGVEKNDEEALKWYREGAKYADGLSMCALGTAYRYGNLGLERNDAEAAAWFRRAADVGHAKGMARLGECYCEGIGVTQNIDEALNWWRKADEKEDREASYKIGECYALGRGVEKNEAEAIKWFHKSAEQGNVAATTQLGAHYLLGLGVEEDKEKGMKFLLEACEKKHRFAMLFLADCYWRGLGVETDRAEAVKRYRQAADARCLDATERLGFAYFNGEGVEQDYEEALKWYLISAENGDNESSLKSCEMVARCYESGKGVEKDVAISLKWRRRAAELGSAQAANDLGERYFNGADVEQDYAEAIKWYRNAAEKNSGRAMRNLGVCYENGKGVEKNLNEAKRWYRRATLSDDEEACAAAEKDLERLNRLESENDGE